MQLKTIERLNTNQRRSSVVIFNHVVYLGGQTCDDKSLDIRGQTRMALEKIDGFLADAGTSKSRLLTAQIWIKDIGRDFEGMNEVWDAWVAPGCGPARATAQCSMAKAGTLVEIVVTAAAGESPSE